MRIAYSLLFSLVLGCAGLLLAACSLEPEAPVDERRSKDHGDPTRVELTLRHGAWDGTIFTPDAGETADDCAGIGAAAEAPVDPSRVGAL